MRRLPDGQQRYQFHVTSRLLPTLRGKSRFFSRADMMPRTMNQYHG